MLEAFVAGDAASLLECAAVHHGRLLGTLATLPRGAGLFASEPDDPDPEPDDQGAPCTSS
jgi:hypothetical protein